MFSRRLGLMLVAALIFFSCEKSEKEPDPPYIRNVGPATAAAGVTIKISGGNFNQLKDSAGCVKVYFVSATTCARVTSDSTAEVQVPFGAGTGTVCVGYNGARICSGTSFTYIPGNPGPNTYMQLASIPSPPTAMTSTNDAVLAGYRNWYKYSVVQDKWTPMKAPTDIVIGAAGFTWNNKGYLFGGTLDYGPYSNRLQMYDPATDTWSFKAPLPGLPRTKASVTVWNNKVYVAGGENSLQWITNQVGQELWVYDPAADSWERKADLPLGAGEGCYILRIGNKFYMPYIAVGYGVQEYDPATDKWRSLYIDNLPNNAVAFPDKDFSLGYTIGGGGMGSATGRVVRYSINGTGNLLPQDYAQPPVGGYTNFFKAFSAVINNEVYYGMGYFNLNGGVATQGTAFWRYRY